MQHLSTLYQLVNAASTVTELARQSQTFRFGVNTPMTFYLRAESAVVQVSRWRQPMIEVFVQLQAAFGWRLVTDQDDAGVYMVAKRRAVVGGLSRAVFKVNVPNDTYLVLRVNKGHVLLEDVDGMLTIPPLDEDRAVTIAPSAFPALVSGTEKKPRSSKVRANG